MSVVMPDIEYAVIQFLLDDPALGIVVSDRIYAELPPGVVYPCVTVRRISGRSGVPRWLDGATVEVSGWAHRDAAGARAEAHDACEYAVAAMNGISNTLADGAVLCGPVATSGPRSIPDTIKPGVTNPRFVAEVSLTYHPAQFGS